MTLRERLSVERQFKSHIAEELWPLGYRARTRAVLTAALSHDVIAWLGLNTAVIGEGPIEVNPVVGVRHQRVHQLIAELRGERAHTFAPPTIATSIGYLLPQKQYTPWLIQDDTVEAAARTLAVQIKDVALPFARERSTLESLVEALKDYTYIDRQARTYRLPVALLLLGRTDDAAREVELALRELEGATFPAARDYSRFATAFFDFARSHSV